MIIYEESGNNSTKVFERVLNLFHRFKSDKVHIKITRDEANSDTYYKYIVRMAPWCDVHEYTLQYIGEFIYATYEDDEPLMLEDFSYEMLKVLELKLKEMLKEKKKK